MLIGIILMIYLDLIFIKLQNDRMAWIYMRVWSKANNPSRKCSGAIV